jgi:hypothetical protein
MGWMHMAEDRDKWRALINMVVSLRAAHNSGNCLAGFGAVRLAIRTVENLSNFN